MSSLNYVTVGNIGNDYFHYMSVSPEEVPSFVSKLLLFIGLDMLSLVISTIFLKLSVNINLIQVNSEWK